jgi:hypothetical protein
LFIGPFILRIRAITFCDINFTSEETSNDDGTNEGFEEGSVSVDADMRKMVVCKSRGLRVYDGFEKRVCKKEYSKWMFSKGRNLVVFEWESKKEHLRRDILPDG